MNPVAQGRRAFAAVLVAAAAGLVPAAAMAASGSGSLPAGCNALEPHCYDELPPNVTWEGAVHLDQVPNKYQGDLVGVALIDTGVTPSPDLGGRLLARVDLTSDGDGIDHYGHGTHMAGLIAGDGTRAFGSYEGGAPEANLVSVKVAGWDGATDVSSVIAGLQWTVANKARYGLRVVNLSFGTDGVQAPDRDPLDYAVERAWRAGLVVVVSAGNTGGPVSKPGDDPYAITVGAADVHDPADPADDTVAAFSSFGDGKPDLVAPGISMPSMRAPSSTIDDLNPAARMGQWYFKGSGTSQAAAVVSGVIARMLEANPALTPNQVKGILLRTASGAPAGPGAGAGLVDAAAAVALATPAKKGPQPVLPRANDDATPSSGLGGIAASRGTDPVYADLNGDGLPDPVDGEVDVFGRPWDPAAFVAATWTADAFAATPWGARATEVAGSATAPPPTHLAGPEVVWSARHWGAADWVAAGDDPALWTARHWGARHWGSIAWR